MRSLLYALTVLSLPMRGAWIEILSDRSISSILPSLPMRGAWIEIFVFPALRFCTVSLPMRGAWIEIVHELETRSDANGRSPCGERGLKLSMNLKLVQMLMVAPHAGSVD